jgi:hypothetical protein
VPKGFRCHHVHEEDGAVLGTEHVRAQLETEVELHVVLEVSNAVNGHLWQPVKWSCSAAAGPVKLQPGSGQKHGPCRHKFSCHFLLE